MSFSDEDYALIEQYLRGSLSGQQLDLFRKRLAEDIEFQQEVALHKAAKSALLLQLGDDMRQHLNSPELDAFKKRTLRDIMLKKRLKSFFYLLITGLLLFGIYKWITRPGTGNSVPQENNVSPADSSRVVPTETLDSNTQHQAGHKKEVPDVHHMNDSLHRKYFAMYFKPAVNYFQSGNTRDTSQANTIHPFFKNYNQGRFEAAILAYPIGETDKNWQYYLANAYMATGRMNKAVSMLEKLVQDNDFNYQDQAKWYLALCYIQQSRISAAKTLLQALQSEQPNETLGIQSAKLLKLLE